MPRTYETWEVCRALKRHPSWTASAPKNNEWVAMVAKFENRRVVISFPDPSVRANEKTDDVVDRSDWTITKPKRKAISIGPLERRGNGWKVLEFSFEKLDRSKKYELFAREVTDA